jgi:hypothetical protein
MVGSAVSAALSPRDGAAALSLMELHAQPLEAVSPASMPHAPAAVVDLTKPTRVAKKRRRRDDSLGFSPSDPPKKLTKTQQRAFERHHPIEFAKWRAAKNDAWWRRHIKAEREQRIARWLRKGTAEVPRYMTRETPLMRPEVERPEPEIAAKVEQPLVKTFGKCWCGACVRVRRERHQVHAKYVCRMGGCRLKFRDLVAFLDHQVDTHAMINVHCRRTREEVYRTQAAMLFPPETVYIAFQYLRVTERPTLWTMEQVEEEKATLESRVASLCTTSTRRSAPRRFIRKSFKVAYERIQQYGIAELHEQYRIALEHYESALVFPVGPRNRQDVISAVRVGRNWLLSPEPENADRTRVLKCARPDETSKTLEESEEEMSDDEGEDEDEVVLFQMGAESEEPSVRKAMTASHKEKALAVVSEPVKKMREMHRAIEEPHVISL